MITVDVRDEITPFIRSWLQQNPRFMRSLSKSIGWYVRGSVRRLVRDGNFPNRWEKRTPIEIRRKLDSKAPIQWLGKLRQAIVYQSISNDTVAIGWGSYTAAMEGRIQEEGIARKVTPFLRRYFGRRGVPLKGSTTQIVVPARPLFEPAMDTIRSDLGVFINNRVAEWINNNNRKVDVEMKGEAFDKTNFNAYRQGQKYEVFG